MTRTLCLISLAVVGCRPATETRYLPDTALPQPDTGPVDACSVAVFETRPVDGARGVYYRDPMRVTFDEDGRAATIKLSSADGVFEPVEVTWDDPGLNATVTPLNPLDASTDYALSVQVCPDNDAQVFTFGTSSFGAPLEIQPRELQDRTFHLPLGGATYEEPPGLGPIIAAYLDQPLLVGVVGANVDSINLMGAQGYTDGPTGELRQLSGRDTFYFGTADFRARPFFATTAAAVPLVYDDIEILFYNFYLEGTFSSDGAAFGSPKVRGLIDTRNLGPLLGIGNEDESACEYVAGVGLDCIACPDGRDLCLNLRATFPTAEQVDDLTLVPR